MEDYKIVDTSKLQLQSIKNFLSELGYTYLNKDYVFYCPYPSAKARSWISLSTACKLHNGHYFEWHGRVFNPPFDNIPAEWIASAMKAKIIHTVYLQRCKKGNYIKAQKHLVKFVNPENISLFIK